MQAIKKKTIRTAVITIEFGNIKEDAGRDSIRGRMRDSLARVAYVEPGLAIVTDAMPRSLDHMTFSISTDMTREELKDLVKDAADEWGAPIGLVLVDFYLGE